MKLAAWLALASVIPITTVTACGVDSYLTCGDPCADASNDVGATDAPIDVPVACTTLDASCVPPIPAGWTLVAIETGATVTCPQGFTTTALATNPVLGGNACVCSGCTATSGWTCSATLAAGATCTTETLDASTSVCWPTVHQSFSETLVRSGSPACTGAQQVGDQSVVTTPLTTCTPTQCDVDVCALKGFELCVTNGKGDSCPAGFPTPRVAGTKGAASCNPCGTCGVANPTAPCTGSVTAYSNATCNGTPFGSTSTSGQCTQATAGFMSVYYDAGPPPVPVCQASGGSPGGTATLVGSRSICCMP